MLTLHALLLLLLFLLFPVGDLPLLTVGIMDVDWSVRCEIVCSDSP